MTDESARRVSVVIPTFGKSALLSSTLSALEVQTYPADLTEVVVVDDCSPDDTPELLARLRAPYRLVSRRHDTNRGRAAARNTGVRAASGDLVVFLDDDMRADRRLVEEHVRFHGSHERAVAIGHAVTAPELGRSSVFTFLDTRGVQKLRAGERSPARYFSTNNSSVTRQSLLDVGLFDESFLSYGFEDTEIAFRLEADAGLSFWYCAQAVAHHIHHHTLDQLLSKRLEGARSTLPALLARHPAMASELSVDGLLPPAPNDGPALRAKKMLLGLAMAAPLERAARGIASRIPPGALSSSLIEYLVACQYRHGLGLAAADARAAPEGAPSARARE